MAEGARLAIFGLAALAGCAGVGGRDEFHLGAEEVTAAWHRSLQPEEREAEQQGTSPPGLAGPFFSAARCRWVEPERKAFCRYRVSRGPPGRGGERYWIEEGANLYRSEAGWSFGG